MIRYVTAKELAALARRPIGTIYWLAHRDQWRRSPPGQRPVLYNAEDAGRTLAALDTVTSSQA